MIFYFEHFSKFVIRHVKNAVACLKLSSSPSPKLGPGVTLDKIRVAAPRPPLAALCSVCR